MKIWVDILTPKQANLFSIFSRRLKERGHELIITTRRYREVNELLELRGVDARAIGRHGGGSLRDKLVESAKRTAALGKVMGRERPEATISFSSPEAARVSYGLRIPYYCISDSPHAEAVCRLTVPLASKLFAPMIIPKRAWTGYGIASRHIVRYNALDPVVWLRDLKPSQDVVRELGLSKDRPIVVVRPDEEFAAYLMEGKGTKESVITQVIEELGSAHGLQLVALPRYDHQAGVLRRRFQSRLIVPTSVVDAVSLLAHASLFVGAGGTMTTEAALMGVPSISCFPSEPTFVERYLIRLGLVERITRPNKIVKRAEEILARPTYKERQRINARRLISHMEDPLKVITLALDL